MKKMFYTQPLLEQQQCILRKKKAQFCIITAAWALLTVAVFLLLTRDRLFICTLTNGVVSSAYFSWLLYFVSYDYKKEREYARLIQEILTGKEKTITGVITKVETEETPLEKEYRIHFTQNEPENDSQMFRFSGRENARPKEWEGASVVLHVYQDRVTGIEVEL